MAPYHNDRQLALPFAKAARVNAQRFRSRTVLAKLMWAVTTMQITAALALLAVQHTKICLQTQAV